MSAPPRSDDPSREPISIWHPVLRDGEPVWERPAPSPLGDHHATARVLRPKRAALPRRICLLGESAAAGYLYAPHVTPAGVLEEQLRALAGPGRYELIDLARTNETLGPLVETAEAALQLEPDLFVIYAGNNQDLLETPEVSPYVPSAARRREVAAALDQAGPAGPVGLARKRLAGKLEAALERLAALASETRAEAATPVIVLLPEVNLADWESRQPPVWLPGDDTARWYDLLEDARAALAAKDPRSAERAAWEMIRLDGSSCPTPFRLLARIWRSEGRLEEARDAAVAEVDSVRYPLLCFLDAPRATTLVRELLAAGAERHGFTPVDLRTVFAHHTGSPLPGRRLFLDYCHLTLEGMGVAMAAVAERVLRLCPVPAREEPALPDQIPEPTIDRGAEAAAFLGAAVHGAHRLLPLSSDSERDPDRPPEILEHWCTRALERSPGIAETMVDLVAARMGVATDGPEPFTETLRRLQAPPHRLTLQHGLRWDNLDAPVLRAILRALERAGRPEAHRVRGLIAETADRLAEDAPVDLARDARFLAEPLARTYPEAMDLRDLPGRAMLRAPWPVTGFALPAGSRPPRRLELVARLPPIPGVDPPRTGEARVTVNGRAAGAAALGEGWRRADLPVPADPPPPSHQPILHRIEIHWPCLPPLGDAARRGARDRLARGVEADLHPIFGEVFSLLVRW